MKKLLFTAAAVLAFGLTNAQEARFGAKGGVNFSNAGGDAKDSKIKVGFAIGGFAEIKLTDKFAVQPELMFSMLGSKEDFGGTTVSNNLNYIVLPIMAKYFVTEQLGLEVGPQIGFLISAKATAGSESLDVKDGLNSTDFGLNFGAGYDVTEDLNIGLRYTLGLSNTVKESGDKKFTNTNIGLALGYKF